MRKFRKKKSRLSDFGFRSQLRKLMGTDVIRLNDRKWNEELENRIHEEFERRQDLHEEALAEAEVLRIRKLRLEGVISLTEDDLDYSENCRRKEKEKAKGKSRKLKHRKRSQSPQNIRRRSSSPSRSIAWRKSPEHISTQVELMEDSASEQEIHVDGDVRSKREGTNSGKRIQRTNSPQAQKHKTKRKTRRQVPAEIQKPFNEEGANSSQAKDHETKPKPRRPVPAKIQELYDEESVDGLYSLADKLIVADTGPKVKIKVHCS